MTNEGRTFTARARPAGSLRPHRSVASLQPQCWPHPPIPQPQDGPADTGCDDEPDPTNAAENLRSVSPDSQSGQLVSSPDSYSAMVAFNSKGVPQSLQAYSYVGIIDRRCLRDSGMEPHAESKDPFPSRDQAPVPGLPTAIGTATFPIRPVWKHSASAASLFEQLPVPEPVRERLPFAPLFECRLDLHFADWFSVVPFRGYQLQRPGIDRQVIVATQ